jgi:hypothetical protein
VSVLLSSVLLEIFAEPASAARASACSAPTTDALAGVWGPGRLRVLGSCRVAAGTVRNIRHYVDGDLTFSLVLARRSRSLANHVNRSELGGALHVELLPRDGGHLPAPKAGDHVVLTGAWVTDGVEGWNEFHPVWSERINGGAVYRSGPQFGGDPPQAAEAEATKLCVDEAGQQCQGYDGTIGRCLPVPAGTGGYRDAACTGRRAGGGYQWVSGLPVGSRFTTSIAPGTTARLESKHGTAVTCRGEAGRGRYTGAKLLGELHLLFAGCTEAGQACQSAGKPAGVVAANELYGFIDVISTSQRGAARNKLGLEVKAVSGRPFAQFSCGSHTFTIRGGVIAPVATNRMLPRDTLSYRASRGRQAIARFENLGRETLEASIAGGAYEPIGLSLTLVRTNSEAVEIKSFP